VDVCHDKIHANDAETGRQSKVDTFRRVVRLTGPLNDSQWARLLEIADSCPVHRTLESNSRVITELVSA
jgi:putative redox protein